MSAISLFEEKQVRRAWNSIEEKWYFSIDDVVLALTDSANVKDYIKKLRKRDPALDSYWGTNCPPVEMIAGDGKKRKIKAAHTESLFRIIQSIPSPKAEPFKRWLAAVGYERLEEIENPELAAKRIRAIYEQKGYSEEWIEKRLRGMNVVLLRDLVDCFSFFHGLYGHSRLNGAIMSSASTPNYPPRRYPPQKRRPPNPPTNYQSPHRSQRPTRQTQTPTPLRRLARLGQKRRTNTSVARKKSLHLCL